MFFTGSLFSLFSLFDEKKCFLQLHIFHNFHTRLRFENPEKVKKVKKVNVKKTFFFVLTSGQINTITVIYLFNNKSVFFESFLKVLFIQRSITVVNTK